MLTMPAKWMGDKSRWRVGDLILTGTAAEETTLNSFEAEYEPRSSRCEHEFRHTDYTDADIKVLDR